jgi:hypothetical protein
VANVCYPGYVSIWTLLTGWLQIVRVVTTPQTASSLGSSISFLLCLAQLGQPWTCSCPLYCSVLGCCGLSESQS